VVDSGDGDDCRDCHSSVKNVRTSMKVWDEGDSSSSSSPFSRIIS
jgi:hypothetical protein